MILGNYPIQDNIQMQYYINQQFNNTKPSTANILFVADLPDDCCEEDLSNFFSPYNYIIAKVFHSILRTHAFVTLSTQQDAENARRELNGAKITPKYSTTKIAKPVRICKYERTKYMAEQDPQCNLLVKNLDVSARLFYEKFRIYGDIRSCKLMIDISGESKGFGFVSFYKADDAIKAKNELDGKPLGSSGKKKIKINFLEKGRKHVVKRNNLYVKNIPKDNFNDKDLKKIFDKFGEINSCIVRSEGFGFVCFSNPDDAEKALKEMNNKKVFDNLDTNLYVSFAMKKCERKEQLLKKREEIFKLSQKMTIYSKIKDENLVKNEDEFKEQIDNYFKELISPTFKPKHMKIRYESKNAFITMNSQKEAEDFSRKFQKYSKENNTSLYFSLYKSKIERVNEANYFKKYNQFSETASRLSGSKQNSQYHIYNDFSTSSNNSGTKKLVYNDFGNNTKITPTKTTPIPTLYPNQRVYQDYNSFATEPVEDKGKINKDDYGDDIYEKIKRLYNNEDIAAKITGMILALESQVVKTIVEDPKLLDEKIKEGYELIQKEINNK